MVKNVYVDICAGGTRFDVNIESCFGTKEEEGAEVDSTEDSKKDEKPLPPLGLDQMATDERTTLSSNTEAGCIC
ncbi:hypothetical protein HG530_014787 [Fusarium avenaceum]|nr:hypothetical protein HG530_014787 [Fusarium avenaceum]